MSKPLLVCLVSTLAMILSACVPAPFSVLDNPDVGSPNLSSSSSARATPPISSVTTEPGTSTIKFDLTVTVNGNGGVNIGVGTHTYIQGAIVSLTATPENGSRFAKWSGDITDNSRFTIVTIDSNKSVIANFETKGILSFSDSQLEAAIREAIKKPLGDISKSDLDSLTNLTAENWGITDLSGIENCTNLHKLNLRNNRLVDISSLKSLTNLDTLLLDGNQIADISILSNLPKLLHIYLQGNKISDIRPLGNLTNLRDIALGSNQIGDISVLAKLGKLTAIDLGGNRISDISPLASNIELAQGVDIYIDRNPLSSLSINTLIPQLKARGITIHY